MAGATPSPDRNTRFIESSCGILSDSQFAPLLAKRVLGCEEAIVADVFKRWPLDDQLLMEFHRRICGDLVPVAGALALDTLAFAEDRLLTIHPFPDFNGRLTRLWLRELLRRARLPQVTLAVGLK